jgi:hypothetical protein
MVNGDLGRGRWGVQLKSRGPKKLEDPEFMADISPLLASGYEWDAAAAATSVKSTSSGWREREGGGAE